MDRRAGWIDIAILTVMVDAILFNPVIGPITPLLVFAGIGAYFLFRYETIAPLMRSTWLLLSLPGLALLSSLWSVLPGLSAYYALLFAVTVLAGLIMGAGLARGSFLKGMTLAFAIYTVASFLSFHWVPWESSIAFAGLAGSKNASGDMAGTGILASLTCLFYCLSRRQGIAALAILALLPIYLFILVFSHATGALIATTLITCSLLPLIASQLLPLQARSAIVVLIAVVILVLALTYTMWLPALFEAVLSGSGKGEDLTGRAELWYFADHNLIARRPWFGMGYKAFWVHNNLDAEYLWRMMGIATRSGFNFHNTPREILVHLGIVGLAFYSAVALFAAVKLALRIIVTPSHENILALGYVLFFAIKMPFEVIGFDTMHFATMTLFASLAVGLRKAA